MKTEQIFDNYFNGEKNIVTPNVLWFKYERYGDEWLLIELSSGKDFHDNESFGTTFLVIDKNEIVQRIDLDKCFPTLEEAIRYSNTISTYEFLDADRYGEPKHLYTMKDIL